MSAFFKPRARFRRMNLKKEDDGTLHGWFLIDFGDGKCRSFVTVHTPGTLEKPGILDGPTSRETVETLVCRSIAIILYSKAA